MKSTIESHWPSASSKGIRMSEQTLGKARGLNSIADPSNFKGSRGRKGRGAEEPSPPEPNQSENAGRRAEIHVVDDAPATDAAAPVTPHRAVVPGVKRKRRELSIPIPVAKVLAETGVNPADVVMSAYRTHGDAIFAGGGGRLVSRGRERLRLSISDVEFDKISRLGDARGWNRSETVAVLLTMELFPTSDEVDDV